MNRFFLKHSIVLLELLSQQYFYEGDSEISAINRMVKLAGTDVLPVLLGIVFDQQEKEKALFNKLCEGCHMRFPLMESQIKEIVEEKIPIV